MQKTFTEADDIPGLLSAYGYEYEPRSDDMSQDRYRGEAGAFIDVWFGWKKGTTIAVYDTKLKRLVYHRGMSLAKIEDVLIKLKK